MTSSGPTDCSIAQGRWQGGHPLVITQHCRAKAGVPMPQLLLFPHPPLSPPSCCPHPLCLPWSFSDLYLHPPRVPGLSVEAPEGILTLFWCPVGPWHLEGLGRPEPAALALTKSRCQTENRPPPPPPPIWLLGFLRDCKRRRKTEPGRINQKLGNLRGRMWIWSGTEGVGWEWETVGGGQG